MERGMALSATIIVFALVVSVMDIGFTSITGSYVKEDFSNSFKFKSGDGVIVDDQAVTFLKGASKKNGISENVLRGDRKVLISLVPSGRNSESVFPKELLQGKFELYNTVSMVLLDFEDNPEIKDDWALISFPDFLDIQYFTILNEGDFRTINGHKVSLVGINVKDILSGTKNQGEVLLNVDGEEIVLRTFEKSVKVKDLFIIVDGIGYDKAKLYFSGVNEVDF